ncbi:MAG: hypothetical protein ACLS6O_02625 [Bifidobacterium sp.]
MAPRRAKAPTCLPPEAIAVYQGQQRARGIAKAANAGGVAVSAWMSQNPTAFWTLKRLTASSSPSWRTSSPTLEAAKEYGYEGDLMSGQRCRLREGR